MSKFLGDFSAIRITDEGKDLIAKNRQGQTLTFTRVALGDGSISSDDEIDGLTALKSEKHSVNITKIENTRPGQVRIQFNINNSEILTPFKFREIGVMAKLEGGEEKLYCYSNAGENANMIYDKNAPIQERIVYLDFVVATSDNVKIVLNLSNIYATMDNLKEELNTHNNDENAHPKLFNKITAAQDAKIKEHREKAELDHPDRSVKEKHLAEASVGRLQLKDNSVYGTAIKNGSITPEKLSREYLPLSNGKVTDTTTFTGIANFNNIVTLSTNKITDNSNSAISSSWARDNFVSSVCGKKGNVAATDILSREAENPDISGLSARNIIYNYTIDFLRYTQASKFKKGQAPIEWANILTSFSSTEVTQLAMGWGNGTDYQKGIYFRAASGDQILQDTPWDRVLTKNTIDECLIEYQYDLRNKTSDQLAQLGFRKLYYPDNANNYGYPSQYCTVLNIPAKTKDQRDVRQLAFNAYGDIYYRSINNGENTNNVPWVKAASTDYVDKAIKNATKVEILDFE